MTLHREGLMQARLGKIADNQKGSDHMSDTPVGDRELDAFNTFTSVLQFQCEVSKIVQIDKHYGSWVLGQYSTVRAKAKCVQQFSNSSDVNPPTLVPRCKSPRPQRQLRACL
jgi:hypothetical protein